MRPRKLICAPLGVASLAVAAFLALAADPTAADRNAPLAGPGPGSSLTAEMEAFPEAGATADAGETKTVKRAVPDATTPGDCLIIRLPEEAREADCILYDNAGKAIARAAGFRAGESAGAPWVFVLAVPATARPGLGRLETVLRREDGSVIDRAWGVSIAEKSFMTEEVRLTAKNAAIRSDFSRERMKQIDRLNEILFRFDSGAPRYFGPWKSPVGGAPRSAAFFDTRTYLYPKGTRETTYHYGIDFGVPRGTPVFSSGDGIVVLAESRISTGWSVVVEHLPGVYSLYYHLDSLAASEGEAVRAGTLIGRSGSTGLSTGPHLHWEFRVNGEAVSPDWFLSRE